MEVCNSVHDQLVYIVIENTPQLARNTPNCLNCCSSVVFSIIITYFVTCHALSTPHLDTLFTINLPTDGQRVQIHLLSCKLTYDLQPIVNNTPERTIVKGDRSKHCRSVVADQIATNRTNKKSYDPV